MLPQQFKDYTPQQQKVVWNENDAPFSWQCNSSKRKGWMRESLPRKVDKKSRVSEEERSTWDPWGEARGLGLSRRRKGHFFFLHCFVFSSVAQSYLTLCNPLDCSMPGFPVHHWLTELTQTPVHWVGDAIQPPYPLSSPSPPAFNHSQHQGHFQSVSSWHQVAKKLEFQLQHQSFQWMFRTDFL